MKYTPERLEAVFTVTQMLHDAQDCLVQHGMGEAMLGISRHER